MLVLEEREGGRYIYLESRIRLLFPGIINSEHRDQSQRTTTILDQYSSSSRCN